MKTVLGVIPSRYASTRLPGKPLALIAGKPMVQWVYEKAKKALPRVVVATDDQRVVTAVRSFGGEVLMTPRSCRSGTERMAAVAKKIPADFYVNIQGDEPLLHPQSIRVAVALALKKNAPATAATVLKPVDWKEPSVVKVVVGANDQSLYFSRAPIPFVAHGVRETQALKAWKHLGLYVYPKKILLDFVRWKPTALEMTEKLEQLRALYYGCPLYVAFTPHDSIGVDTPADLKRVQKILLSKSKGDGNSL